MTARRPAPPRSEDPRMPAQAPPYDPGYAYQRPRSFIINWSAVSIAVPLFGAIFAFIWMAATQNAVMQQNHVTETAAIAASNAAIAQLQADSKEQAKQQVDMVIQLTSINQTLKTMLTYGVPRAAPAVQDGSATTIINQPPAANYAAPPGAYPLR